MPSNSLDLAQTGLKKWSVSMSIDMNCLAAFSGSHTGLAQSPS